MCVCFGALGGGTPKTGHEISLYEGSTHFAMKCEKQAPKIFCMRTLLDICKQLSSKSWPNELRVVHVYELSSKL